MGRNYWPCWPGLHAWIWRARARWYPAHTWPHKPGHSPPTPRRKAVRDPALRICGVNSSSRAHFSRTVTGTYKITFRPVPSHAWPTWLFTPVFPCTRPCARLTPVFNRVPCYTCPGFPVFLPFPHICAPRSILVPFSLHFWGFSGLLGPGLPFRGINAPHGFSPLFSPVHPRPRALHPFSAALRATPAPAYRFFSPPLTFLVSLAFLYSFPSIFRVFLVSWALGSPLEV